MDSVFRLERLLVALLALASVALGLREIVRSGSEARSEDRQDRTWATVAALVLLGTWLSAFGGPLGYR